MTESQRLLAEYVSREDGKRLARTQPQSSLTGFTGFTGFRRSNPVNRVNPVQETWGKTDVVLGSDQWSDPARSVCKVGTGNFCPLLSVGGLFIVESTMTESQRLFAEYRTSGSEAAFRALVARCTDLVYSTALRLVEGDTQRAEDVAQTVFLDLARKARKLSAEGSLAGWLYRHTCFMTANAMRGERRRQAPSEFVAGLAKAGLAGAAAGHGTALSPETETFPQNEACRTV
jgi:hypothetical protein